MSVIYVSIYNTLNQKPPGTQISGHRHLYVGPTQSILIEAVKIFTQWLG